MVTPACPPSFPPPLCPPTAMEMIKQDPGDKVVLHQVPLMGKGGEVVSGFNKAAETLVGKRH